MITLPKLAAQALGSFLAADMKDRFGRSHARLAEIIPFAAQLTLECIGNSDALFHSVEHTMLVTLAGHDIFKGRALLTLSTPIEYANFIVACLTHDIGYVRGVVKGDGNDGLVVDAAGRKVTLPRGSSDAALAPYHVDRSKLFVLDRFAEVEEIDGALIAGAIEHTRFPFSSVPEDHATDEWAALLRAADLIGQLGDPHYLRKTNALYHEFEENGMNRQLGYESSADLVDKYPQFYWDRVSPHIQNAVRYLNVTSSGRQWINGLYSNVFRAEHEQRRLGVATLGPVRKQLNRVRGGDSQVWDRILCAGMLDVALIRERFEALSPHLDERGRRLFAATEAAAAGYGGIAAVSRITGIAASTIGRGLNELAAPTRLEPGRIRRSGGGRKALVVTDRKLLDDLNGLVEPEARGDPMSPLRWTCKSLRRVAAELAALGHRLPRSRE